MRYLCIETCVCNNTSTIGINYTRYVKNVTYTLKDLRFILDRNPKLITTNFIAISDDTDKVTTNYGFEERTYYLCTATFVDDKTDYTFEKNQIYYCSKDYKLINSKESYGEHYEELIDISFNREDKFIKLGKPLFPILKDIIKDLIIVIAIKDVPGHFTKGSFYSMRIDKEKNYRWVYDNNGIAYHIDDDSKLRKFCFAYNNDESILNKTETITSVENKPDDKPDDKPDNKALYHILIYICGIKAYHCVARSSKLARAIQKYDKYSFIEIKIQRLKIIEDYDCFIKDVIKDKLKLK